MFKIRRRSAWSFDTSSSKGAGAGLVNANQGTVTLRSPTGQPYKFSYYDLGIGPSLAIKIPVTLSVSTETLPSFGALYVLDKAPRPELTLDDLSGPCHSVTLSAGSLGNASISAVLLGMDYQNLGDETLGHAAWLMSRFDGSTARLIDTAEAVDESLGMTFFRDSAKALLVFGGASFGLQIGFSASGNMGYFGSPAALST